MQTTMLIAAQLVEPLMMETGRSSLPLFFVGIGVAAAASGAVIARVRSANTGVGIGIAGAALLVCGLVWFLLQPSHEIQTREGELSVPYAVAF